MDPALPFAFGRGRIAITGATTIAGQHQGLLVDATSGTFSVAATAAAALGGQFAFCLYNSGSGTVTFNPDGTETVRTPAGAATTLALTQGQGAYLVCDGANWLASLTVGLPASPSAALTVLDTSFTVQNASDTTKQFQFLASGITAGQTRIYTMPNSNGTVPLLGLAQTFSEAQTIQNGATNGLFRGFTLDNSNAGASRRCDMRISTNNSTSEALFLGVDQAGATYKAYLDNRSGGDFELQASGTAILRYSASAFTFLVNATSANSLTMTNGSGTTIVVSSTQASTNSTTGCSTFAGGVGIAGALNIAGNFGQTGATTFGTGTGAVSLNGAVTTASTLVVGAQTTINYSSAVLVVGNGGGSPSFYIDGAAGSAKQFFFRTNGSSRWLYECTNTAESGSDAGSNFRILARTDTGSAIDTPIQINRAAGTSITLARPTSITNTTSSSTTTTGALTVAGGVGIVENLNVGGALTLGTDLAVAQGGTGASTANLARKNINQGTVALTDGANIATDCALGNVFTVTLGGNRTLDNPTNLVAGATYIWIITQDGAGGRTLAFGTAFKFPGGTDPVVAAGIGDVSTICGVSDGTSIFASGTLDFS